jgi:hypothetical protein
MHRGDRPAPDTDNPANQMIVPCKRKDREPHAVPDQFGPTPSNGVGILER